MSARMHRTGINVIDCAVTSAEGDAYAAHLAFCDMDAQALEAAAPPVLWRCERTRADRFLTARGRNDFLRGRLAAKAALAALAEQSSASAFRVVPGIFGQPVVAAPFGHLGVSISHGADAALAVAHSAECPLGVDLERIDPDQIGVLRSQANASEEADLRQLGLSPAVALTVLWSAREALSKVLRGGLSVDAASLVFDHARQEAGVVHLRPRLMAHLRVELRLATHAVLALALPSTAHCDWAAAHDWLFRFCDEERPAA